MIQIIDILLLLGCYFLGAIPFSVVVGKVFYNTDVRLHGSGNPGATNTLRILGTNAGLIVLALDMLKGMAAVWIAGSLTTWPDITIHDRMTIGGALAISGHVFSPFLGFKGGKGVATTIGVIIALEPIMACMVVMVFLVVLSLTKYVSLSSICAAFTFSILTLLLRTGMVIPLIFSLGITLLIVLKHKDNIIRLIKGQENKFVLRKKTN